MQPLDNTSKADPHGAISEHEYDGIQEYDNPLPGWWSWLFIFTIVFSLGYFFFFHITGGGPSMGDIYEVKKVEYMMAQLAQLGEIHPDDATILDFMNRPDWMNAAAGMFRGTCAQCHTADGGGNIGPNLTDDAWLHVRVPSDIFKTITEGVPGTSMPTFRERFREPQRILLAAYVASLRGTTPAQPKAPQGTVIPPWPVLPKPAASTDASSAAETTGDK